LKLECSVLVEGLGWFTLIPREHEINCSNAVEIGARLIEMVSGVKRIEFTRIGEGEKKKPIFIERCKQCNLPNFIDPNYVHGENGEPFAWHCTFCCSEIDSKIPLVKSVK
jgi:hypothetical protein